MQSGFGMHISLMTSRSTWLGFILSTFLKKSNAMWVAFRFSSATVLILREFDPLSMLSLSSTHCCLQMKKIHFTGKILVRRGAYKCICLNKLRLSLAKSWIWSTTSIISMDKKKVWDIVILNHFYSKIILISVQINWTIAIPSVSSLTAGTFSGQVRRGRMYPVILCHHLLPFLLLCCYPSQCQPYLKASQSGF